MGRKIRFLVTRGGEGEMYHSVNTCIIYTFVRLKCQGRGTSGPPLPNSRSMLHGASYIYRGGNEVVMSKHAGLFRTGHFLRVMA